jgi:ABC-type polysaccharide/polyol phosphate transport system ATPase subunit
MTPTVQFFNISKKYQLGKTRISLPALFSNWARTTFSREKEPTIESGSLWALQDVSFELEKGDSLALVGANGAGKTTILKLLANITKPTSGEINVNGKLSALIELGAGFHPDLSGRENIFLNGTILGLKNEEIKKKFDSIVSFAELEKFIDTPVKRYSSGMVVRLGFAVAASIDPDILLVDEVLAVGDAAFRLKCMERIQGLIDNGTTLIFVSHNMGLVKAVCGKALFIEKGVPQKFGVTNDVIEAYNHSLNEQRISKAEELRDISPHIFSTCEVTMVEVIVLDQETSILNPFSPAKIRVHYRAFQNLSNVSVVIRIMRSDGVSCAALYSKTDDTHISFKKGTGFFDVTLAPLQLYPGVYYVTATAKNEDDTIVHDMAYSDWFQVVGLQNGNEDADAVFEPNRIWHHNPLTDKEFFPENTEEKS